MNTFNIHLGSEIECNLKPEVGALMCLLMERHQGAGLKKRNVMFSS